MSKQTRQLKKKKSILDDPKWKDAKKMHMNFSFTGYKIRRACLRFKCKGCKSLFIGLIEHRDPVPEKCSVCKPPPDNQHWVWLAS